jgi:hypothetical protein
VLTFVAGVLSLLIATPALAGPLPDHWVAPGSDWLIHVDAERLAQAEALTPLFDAMAASAWGASLTDMGIDARMDVSGITMFGTITRSAEARGETTTMLRGGASLREAIQKHVEAHQGYTLVLRSGLQTGGQRITAWTIDALSVHVALVPLPKGRGNPESTGPAYVAVLSDNSERLQTCIALVLSEPTRPESRPAPSEGEVLLGVENGPECPPPGCVMFAWAKDLDRAHPPPRSALLASARSLVAHLGYRQEGEQTVVFAGLKVCGTEEADARAMVSALDGMVDFWRRRVSELAADDARFLELLPLVEACRVSSEAATLRLSMERAIATPGAMPTGVELVSEPDDEAAGRPSKDR